MLEMTDYVPTNPGTYYLKQISQPGLAEQSVVSDSSST